VALANGICRALVGGALGAVCGVVLVGILGMLSGVRFIIEHAEDLSYGLGSLPAGFVLFAFHIGIPVGAPIGAVLGTLVGIAKGKVRPHPQASVDARANLRSRRLGAQLAAAAFIVIATILCGTVVVPIMMRRRELEANRAEGDRIEQEVAILGGRPHYEPGLTRQAGN
jgi:hypothetical protein